MALTVFFSTFAQKKGKSEMTTNYVRILSADQIRRCGITPAQCIDWVEESFKLKYEAQLPVKLTVHPQGDDFFNSMPALLPERFGRFGLKIVSRMEAEKPALKSDILLYDSKTGKLLAIADGDWITAMRTGAVTALSVRTFKRRDADTYSIMGLGNTARATALCLIDDAKGRKVKFRLLRYKDQAELFIERFKDATNATFEIIDTMEEFVTGAIVIISCITNAHSNIFCNDDSKFQKGVLIVPVHSRGFQNCDLFFDKVFGDDTGHISGFRFFPKFRRYDEFSRVLLGQNPGRENDEERILNYNAGLGIHDVFFASKLYDLMSQTHSEGFYQQRVNNKFWV